MAVAAATADRPQSRRWILLPLLATFYLLGWRIVWPWYLNRSLIAAVHQNDLGAVRSLLARGADPNATEMLYSQLIQEKIHGMPTQATSKPPALAIALYQSVSAARAAANTEIVLSLLRAGADPNVRYRYGNTALMGAVWRDNKPVVRYLFSRHVEVDARNAFGATPLMQAAEIRDSGLISLLLAKGADIQAKDQDGSDALRFAIRSGNLIGVRELIQHHADLNAKQRGGPTALGLAKAQKMPQIVAALEEAGAPD